MTSTALRGSRGDAEAGYALAATAVLLLRAGVASAGWRR